MKNNNMLNELHNSNETTADELKSFEAAMSFIQNESPKIMDSMGLRVAHNAERFAERPCISFEGLELNWREFNNLTNRYAHVLYDIGIREGDVVGLMLDNRIEYCAVLCAISKLKAVASLINTSLTGEALAHCLNISSSNKLIFGEEVSNSVDDFRHQLDDKNVIEFMYVRDLDQIEVPKWSVDLKGKIGSASQVNPTEKPFDKTELVLYIFTSGTTGMPKAVNISNSRHLGGAIAGWKVALKNTENDRLYLVLPLYHGTGLTVGFGACVYAGSFLYLKRRFSAREFISDVNSNNLNAFIYVGEICRYLMSLPEQTGESNNPITTMSGNGLRPEIWNSFKNRFGINRICELYSASEANVNFFNALNKDCTIGFPSNEISLVKYDIDQDEIVRDDVNRCKLVANGSAGLMLSKISDAAKFQGYTDSHANESKIVRNVFEDGDAWFNSGDLLKKIDVGYSGDLPHYQFVDRVGDTFRWKSENVSTMEVEEIIHRFPDIEICNVYGVEVPNNDGKACMAAIKLTEATKALDIGNFIQHLSQYLPHYARPCFFRIAQEMDTTGTFKLVKSNLRRDGFSPNRVTDKMYVFCNKSATYIPLEQDIYNDICSGTRRI